jgi:hypothetical protein
MPILDNIGQYSLFKVGVLNDCQYSEEGSFRKSALSHFQYSRQAAILNFVQAITSKCLALLSQILYLIDSYPMKVPFKISFSHFQCGRQAAILSFACSGDNYRMLGPVEFKVCMLIDSHHTKVPLENQLCHIFNWHQVATILNFRMLFQLYFAACLMYIFMYLAIKFHFISFC